VVTPQGLGFRKRRDGETGKRRLEETERETAERKTEFRGQQDPRLVPDMTARELR
jgi:hypothetical protein